MTPFGQNRGPLKWLTAVAAALALTLAPAQGRCDSYSILGVLMELANPQKPECPCNSNSPCCPQGVCRGASTMPCCPNSCPTCDKGSCNNCQNCCKEGCDKCEKCSKEGCENCEGCAGRSVCPINEPEGCRQAGDCQPALERQAKELRRLCAEHERTIHELEVIVRELCLEISGLRQDIQAMRHQERPHFVIRYEDQSQFAPPYNMQRAQDASPIHLGQFVPFGFFVPVPPMRVVPTFMPYDPVTPYDCPGHSDPVQTPSKGIEE